MSHDTILPSGVNARIKRQIAPREYPGPNCPADELNRRPILYRPATSGISIQEFWDTPLARLLKPGAGHSGLWLPNWLGELSPDPIARRLLGFTTWIFDDRNSESAAIARNRKRQETPENLETLRRQPLQQPFRRAALCRAQAFRKIIRTGTDSVSGETSEYEYNVRCFERSIDELAMAIGSSTKVLRRVLDHLIHADDGEEILVRLPGAGALTILPNGYRFARAWLDHCKAMNRPRLDAEGKPVEIAPTHNLMLNWYESEYRREAMNRDGRLHYDVHNFVDNGGYYYPRTFTNPVARGTWVDDLIFAACQRRAGPAHLLSYLIYWQGRNTRSGQPRSSWAIRDGRRYTVLSDRQLARALHYPATSIRHWREWLSSQGFITIESQPVQNWNECRQGIMQYALNAETIETAILAHRHEIQPWKAARLKKKAPALNKAPAGRRNRRNRDTDELITIKEELAQMRIEQAALGNVANPKEARRKWAENKAYIKEMQAQEARDADEARAAKLARQARDAKLQAFLADYDENEDLDAMRPRRRSQ